MSQQKDPTLTQVVMSVLAAFLGVQSRKNHDRDAAYVEKMGFKPYLIAGIILGFGFILVVMTAVNIVLHNLT